MQKNAINWQKKLHAISCNKHSEKCNRQENVQSNAEGFVNCISNAGFRHFKTVLSYNSMADMFLQSEFATRGPVRRRDFPGFEDNENYR